MPQHITFLLLIIVATLLKGEVVADTDILSVPIHSVEPGEMPEEAGKLSRTTEPGASTARQQLPIFGRLPTQFLSAGKRWQLYFQLDTVNGQVPVVRALQMPDGATLTMYDDTWYQIEWTPQSTQAGVFKLLLGAEFENVAGLQTEQSIVLNVAPANVNEPAQEPASSEMLTTPDPVKMAEIEGQQPESVAMPEPGITPAPDAVSVTASLPVLQPISTHIISAGRTVSLRVMPELSNGEPALLDIDRLPRNASLDRSEKGWYTFYWLTSSEDQGEHRFRLSAVHPDDAGLQVFQDMVIIVGDPSYGSTVPRENEPSSAISIAYSEPSAKTHKPGNTEPVNPERAPSTMSPDSMSPETGPERMSPGAVSPEPAPPGSMSPDSMAPETGPERMSPGAMSPEPGPMSPDSMSPES